MVSLEGKSGHRRAPSSSPDELIGPGMSSVIDSRSQAAPLLDERDLQSSFGQDVSGDAPSGATPDHTDVKHTLRLTS